MFIVRPIAALTALLTAPIASTALAQQAPVPVTTAAPAPAAPVPDASADGAFAATAPVDEADLQKVTGRENLGVQVASATQRNTVSNNSVIGTSTTGAIQIDGNAFQNLQGLAVINANSGNNVAINSAMNVTINLGPQ